MATMFMAGYRMQAVAPLEVMIREVRNAQGERRWYVACVGDEGELCTMMPDWIASDDVCSHSTAVEARAAVWRYAERWIAQGLDISYRSDLED